MQKIKENINTTDFFKITWHIKEIKPALKTYQRQKQPIRYHQCTARTSQRYNVKFAFLALKSAHEQHSPRVFIYTFQININLKGVQWQQGP